MAVMALLFSVSHEGTGLAVPGISDHQFVSLLPARSRIGVATMSSVVLVLSILSLVSIYAATSRLLWAFARDGGLHLVGVSQGRITCIPHILTFIADQKVVSSTVRSADHTTLFHVTGAHTTCIARRFFAVGVPLSVRTVRILSSYHVITPLASLKR
jgi:hypothetical protein